MSSEAVSLSATAFSARYKDFISQEVVGGGFTPKGAHNIIEPLALRKPVAWPTKGQALLRITL